MTYISFIFAFIIGSILCVLNNQSVHAFNDRKKNYQLELKQHLSVADSDHTIGKINKDGSVTFDRYGTQFIVKGEVNDVSVHFLVDTGASIVTLARRDAMNLGINLDSLQYKVKVQTAKGMAFVAPVMFDSVRIGNIVVKNVRGHVAKEGLSGSLLGMSFLNRLSKYEIRKGGSITFWQ